jgi:hypothetical protein
VGPAYALISPPGGSRLCAHFQFGTPIQRRCCEGMLEARIRSISSEDAWSSLVLAVNGVGGFKEELKRDPLVL